MPHFRVDDALHSHPKAQRAGDDAIGMWVRAGSFCMAYLTDGFVPEWWVKQQPKGTAKAKKLVAAGLWHDGAERDGEKGYQFHEFTGPGRQDSREQIEAEREKWRKKKAGQRAMSPGDTKGDTAPMSPGDTQGESPEDSPYARATRPRANPTQPIKNSGYVTESATVSNARDSVAATPGADLVRQHIDRRHPDATRTALRIQASELLNTGTDPDTVEAALRLWNAKPSVGIGRTILASLCSEVIKSRAAPTQSGSHPGDNGLTAGEAKVVGWAALGSPNRAPTVERKALDQ
ncbi:hypothetical protein [Mycolicibacterium goodii]|uniref:hypothetical protein n=1 Tax=Mycolicibacterium goodii TaxID=134601 RepID=UPI001BDCE4DD|nr:hypothetical protein [Mycolicibacterium goodii]MBU8819568.1 hypothetical protein [Mycolicibacterium goodii]MBU8833620.1 hypothetical protein [Mycolicibacterium goodii]